MPRPRPADCEEDVELYISGEKGKAEKAAGRALICDQRCWHWKQDAKGAWGCTWERDKAGDVFTISYDGFQREVKKALGCEPTDQQVHRAADLFDDDAAWNLIGRAVREMLAEREGAE